MSAQDLLVEVGNPGTATTLSAPGYTAGDTTINVAATTNWPTTGKAVIFAIDEAAVVDGVEVQVAGTYNEFEGTTASATSVSNVDQKRGVGDRNYAAGSLTRVYIPVSAERENRIVEWGETQHKQDGTHSDITADSVTVVNGDATFVGKVITNDNLSTTVGELGGAWQSWTPVLTDLADGTLNYAKYTQTGKTTHFKFKYTLGGAGVSGAPAFTLPVAPADESAAKQPFNAQVMLIDATGGAGGRYPGVALTGGSDDVLLSAIDVSGAYASRGLISSTVPFTWAISDVIFVEGTYEAA
jgi:hypothetical protein